jgi:hypothetical protein
MSDVIANATATEQTGAVNPADAIAAMIAANKRNNPQPESSSQTPAGQEEAKAESPEAAPVEGTEPEDGIDSESETVDSENDAEATDGVTDAVNFLEFAEQNPDMLWRIPNKDAEGGFIEIPVSKAAAILGQGSAIHENARKLKVERAEFEELTSKRINELDGLQIGLELTIVPELQNAADELIQIQEYNQKWQQIYQNTNDPAQKSQAEAAIRQNTQLIEEKSEFIKANRPKVEQFFQQRSAFVQQQLEQSRQSFTDKELSNKVIFGELRDKLAKDWKASGGSLVPGIKNIDLVSSDEYLLGLVRDGMKFREGPKVKNAGGSLAAASRPVAKAKTAPENDMERLQKQAKSGDKNASRDLLATMLAANKQRKR